MGSSPPITVSSPKANPFPWPLLFAIITLTLISPTPHLPASIAIPWCASSAVVILQSIEIYKSREWLHVKPTVYFSCKGENMTILPDVKETNVLYDFRGEESWQWVQFGG